MNQPTNSFRNQILIILLVALAVFTIGLLGISLGMRTIGQRVEPTATTDISSLPLTPLPQATQTPVPVATATTYPSPTTTLTPFPTVTLTPSPTDTSTPLPTETSTPTAVPTATAIPAPTPYAGPFRENSGDASIPRVGGIVVDGVLLEWGGVPSFPLVFIQQGAENFDGPDDFSVNARVAWDNNFLYLAAEVIDDVHVQALRGYDIFNGDSVELWLDADLAGDFNDDSRNGDDFQFGFSPGDFDGSPSEGVVWYPTRKPEWNAQLQVVAQARANGYTLEAAVPWSLLNLRPHTGMAFGFAVNANDNDVPNSAAQQTIFKHTDVMDWGRPTTFSNLRIQ